MKHKLQNPIFIIAVIVLLVNDFYLKGAFGNFLTGKLSDLAGLFAFPFFFSCLLPSFKKHIHIATAILFVFWKSSFSQPLLDGMYEILGFTLTRVIDFSDNMALVSIPLSYLVFVKYDFKPIKPLLQYSIMLVSVFAFIADSQPREPFPTSHFVNIDKEYNFNYSKERLGTNFNRVVDSIANESYYKNNIIFDSINHVYYWKGSNDTIFMPIAVNRLKGNDTIRIKHLSYNLQITGNDKSSKIIFSSRFVAGDMMNDTIRVDCRTDSIARQDQEQCFRNYVIYPLENIFDKQIRKEAKEKL